MFDKLASFIICNSIKGESKGIALGKPNPVCLKIDKLIKGWHGL